MIENQNTDFIKFENVTKIFNDGKNGSTYALHKLDFTVRKSEIVSFATPGGSDK